MNHAPFSRKLELAVLTMLGNSQFKFGTAQSTASTVQLQFGLRAYTDSFSLGLSHPTASTVYCQSNMCARGCAHRNSTPQACTGHSARRSVISSDSKTIQALLADPAADPAAITALPLGSELPNLEVQ